MKRFEIDIKETHELSDSMINEINYLKNQHWKYKIEEHRMWFAKNIRSTDSHIIIRGGGYLLAYLNLVHVDVTINQKHYRMMGIGNVCVNKSNEHLGLGAVLMSIANMFVKDKHLCGILLCRNNLLEFYKKSGWTLLNVLRPVIDNSIFESNIMIYDPYSSIPTHIDYLTADRKF